MSIKGMIGSKHSSCSAMSEGPSNVQFIIVSRIKLVSKKSLAQAAMRPTTALKRAKPRPAVDVMEVALLALPEAEAPAEVAVLVPEPEWEEEEET